MATEELSELIETRLKEAKELWNEFKAFPDKSPELVLEAVKQVFLLSLVPESKHFEKLELMAEGQGKKPPEKEYMELRDYLVPVIAKQFDAQIKGYSIDLPKHWSIELDESYLREVVKIVKQLKV